MTAAECPDRTVARHLCHRDLESGRTIDSSIFVVCSPDKGTNGIQAADIVTHKIEMANGAVLVELMDDIVCEAGETSPMGSLAKECSRIGRWMLDEASLDDRLACSVPFRTMCAVAVGRWQLLRQVMSEGAPDAKPAVWDFPVATSCRRHAVLQAARLLARNRYTC